MNGLGVFWINPDGLIEVFDGQTILVISSSNRRILRQCNDARPAMTIAAGAALA
jgi:hypothetical protein